MIERVVEVVGEVDGRWQLRAESAACQGCDTGCGGRCRLFLGDQDGCLSLPLADHRDLRRGQRIALRIEEDALARAARRGYGLALFGLLAGALCGFFIAASLSMEIGRDALTLLGALAGTFLAVLFSKRHVLATSLHPVAADAETPPHSSKSDPA